MVNDSEPERAPLQSPEFSTSMLNTALAFLSVGAALFASQLPGATFFLKYAPPSVPPLTLLSGGVGLAVFGYVFLHRDSATVRAKRGLRYTAAALGIAVIYSLFFNVTTATPQAGSDRVQIGFGAADFSLKKTAQAWKADHSDRQTASALLYDYGAWSDPSKVWEPWSIMLAGLILSTLFVASYVGWSFGLACIAWSWFDRNKPPKR